MKTGLGTGTSVRAFRLPLFASTAYDRITSAGRSGTSKNAPSGRKRHTACCLFRILRFTYRNPSRLLEMTIRRDTEPDDVSSTPVVHIHESAIRMHLQGGRLVTSLEPRKRRLLVDEPQRPGGSIEVEGPEFRRELARHEHAAFLIKRSNAWDRFPPGTGKRRRAPVFTPTRKT